MYHELNFIKYNFWCGVKYVIINVFVFQHRTECRVEFAKKAELTLLVRNLRQLFLAEDNAVAAEVGAELLTVFPNNEERNLFIRSTEVVDRWVNELIAERIVVCDPDIVRDVDATVIAIRMTRANAEVGGLDETQLEKSIRSSMVDVMLLLRLMGKNNPYVGVTKVRNAFVEHPVPADGFESSEYRACVLRHCMTRQQWLRLGMITADHLDRTDSELHDIGVQVAQVTRDYYLRRAQEVWPV